MVCARQGRIACDHFIATFGWTPTRRDTSPERRRSIARARLRAHCYSNRPHKSEGLECSDHNPPTSLQLSPPRQPSQTHHSARAERVEKFLPHSPKLPAKEAGRRALPRPPRGGKMPAGGYGVLLLKRWLMLVACLRLFSGAQEAWAFENQLCHLLSRMPTSLTRPSLFPTPAQNSLHRHHGRAQVSHRPD